MANTKPAKPASSPHSVAKQQQKEKKRLQSLFRAQGIEKPSAVNETVAVSRVAPAKQTATTKPMPQPVTVNPTPKTKPVPDKPKPNTSAVKQASPHAPPGEGKNARRNRKKKEAKHARKLQSEAKENEVVSNGKQRGTNGTSISSAIKKQALVEKTPKSKGKWLCVLSYLGM